MCGDRGIVILLVIFCAVLEAKHSSHKHAISQHMQLSSSIESSVRDSSYHVDESDPTASEVTSFEESHSAQSSNFDGEIYEDDAIEIGESEDLQSSDTHVGEIPLSIQQLMKILREEERRHVELTHFTPPIHHRHVSHHEEIGIQRGVLPFHFDGHSDFAVWLSFCKEALEEEEPFMVNDGAFHPRYEEVAGVGVYRLHARARSWAEARRVCEREGAQLAVPNSHEEALTLARIHNRCPQLLPTHFNDYQYLGVHDIYDEDQWETVVGLPLHETGYVNWAFNQPDNAHHYGENCLTMNRHTFYNDVPCWTELPFICEHS